MALKTCPPAEVLNLLMVHAPKMARQSTADQGTAQTDFAGWLPRCKCWARSSHQALHGCVLKLLGHRMEPEAGCWPYSSAEAVPAALGCEMALAFRRNDPPLQGGLLLCLAAEDPHHYRTAMAVGLNHTLLGSACKAPNGRLREKWRQYLLIIWCATLKWAKSACTAGVQHYLPDCRIISVNSFWC